MSEPMHKLDCINMTAFGKQLYNLHLNFLHGKTKENNLLIKRYLLYFKIDFFSFFLNFGLYPIGPPNNRRISSTEMHCMCPTFYPPPHHQIYTYSRKFGEILKQICQEMGKAVQESSTVHAKTY